jgi:hypothetical protein
MTKLGGTGAGVSAGLTWSELFKITRLSTALPVITETPSV